MRRTSPPGRLRIIPAKPALCLCLALLTLSASLAAAPKKKEAKPEGPPPPPAIGVTVATAGGARRADAFLPGRLVAAALPRGTDGRRRVVVLTTPDDPKSAGAPEGPRSLYLIDPETSGAPRRLLEGISDEAYTLAVADLDGDGAEEILLGAPGKVSSLGTAEAPTAPRTLLEAPGLELRGGPGEAPVFQAPAVGRLRTWTLDGGRFVPGEEQALPMRAERGRRTLTLRSQPVTAVTSPGGAPLRFVGPEANGKLRLRTLMLRPDGSRAEAWSQLPSPEEVAGFWYLHLDGKPVLIVSTTDAEKIGIFANQRLRLFPLSSDRSRSGQRPSLALETASHRWFPIEPVIADLDKDGKEDLVLLQPEGLAGGDLMIDTFFGQGNGRFEKPRRTKLGNLEARAWRFGRDLTGDGRPDLVTLSKTGLNLYAGTADPRRDLIDRKPRQIELEGAREQITVSVGAGSEGVATETTRPDTLGSPRVEDLDGDGRPEILLFSPNSNGRGRVIVVRLGG